LIVRRAEPLVVLRSALFAAWMFLAALVLGTLSLPLLIGPRRSAMAPIRLWARICLWGLRWIVGLKVEVRGRAAAPKGAALVGAKHQAMLDVLVALDLFPDPCIVLKKELMWIPIFGWFAAKVEMIVIDRSSGAKAVRRLTAATARALADGRQVFIFPEGTRQAPGAPPAYKPGIAALYREMNLPCTPIATNAGYVWPASGLAKYPGTAVYEVLPPIPAGLKRGVFMASLEAAIEGAGDLLNP
jgi:1-acyl-sn-glycerol-3-phosphate acyltransferase